MEAILNVFDKYRMPALQIDEYLTKGRDLLLQKVKAFVEKNLPIKFVMLGFPMKSMNNRDKVLGELPEKIYMPGIDMQIN